MKGHLLNVSKGLRRDVDVGTLLSRTFGNLRLIWRQLLAYLAAVLLIAVIAQFLGDEPGGLIGLLLYLGGQYWLFHAWAKARGALVTPRIRFFAFCGLALLLILPILFGLMLLVIPGIFLVARWLIAPVFIVAQGEGAIEAAGSSWSAVRGHTFAVAAAITILVFAWSIVGGGITGLVAGLLGLDGENVVNGVQAQFYPLMLLGLSTAAYELLGPEDTAIEDVFG